MPARTVLFVHQSAELYGSDRTLLTFVEGLDAAAWRAVVVLPSEGPLIERLVAAGARVLVLPLARLERASARPANLARLPLRVAASLRALDQSLAEERIDLVYTNTLAVVSGAVWAKRRGLPHLWHVHELVVRPRLARLAFARLLNTFATRVVFNSEATRRCYVSVCSALGPRSRVVHNGIERPPGDREAALALRRELGADPDTLLVLQVGRISRWKGQGVLLDAAERLGTAGGLPPMLYVFAGSPPPEQERWLERLRTRVETSAARGTVRLLPFTADVWPLWDACDIAVVPSTEPEPFGLVAVEAMLAGKPVVVSGHGGLLEVVEDGVSGEVVPPKDAVQLAQRLALLALDPARRAQLGAAGRASAQDRFGVGRYRAGIMAALQELLAGSATPSP